MYHAKVVLKNSHILNEVQVHLNLFEKSRSMFKFLDIFICQVFLVSLHARFENR